MRTGLYAIVVGGSLAIAAFLLLRDNDVPPQDIPSETYAILVSHPGFGTDTPRSFELRELVDDVGRLNGYAMEVDSVICLEGQCEVVQCVMVWDLLGRYQRYELRPGEALTKSPATPGGDETTWRKESVPFTEEDHARLDGILRDTYSPLKDLTLEDLGHDRVEVDGVSGATPLAVSTCVVKGAAYTTFNLWHWANGDVATAALELTRHRCDEVLLARFLGSEDYAEVHFALARLREKKIYDAAFIQAAVERAAAGTAESAELAVAYLEDGSPTFGTSLVELFARGTSAVRNYVLEYVKRRDDLPDAVLEAMSLSLGELETYMEVHRLLALLDGRSVTSHVVMERVAGLLGNDDFFIARRAYRFLEARNLDESLGRRVAEFAQQHMGRL